MSYTVLARRYRSRSFDELIGQQHVARTLQHAIENDRTAHAYLFCGTRGVGKTSMARLLAAALNVTDDLQSADEITNAILQGNDLDVIEIDGASNRGINEARDLIASAGLAPSRCQYKIYIIDEVHMLTREAFNALLKTMEEPPSHVKFILCTTEPHRVPATIQSRCQRFDFRPVSTEQIAAHLANVVDAEGLKADAEALMEVARMGDGSVRDALSLLDRLLAGTGTLTLDAVTESIGLADRSLISSIIDAIIAGDAAEAIKQGQLLLNTGISIEQAVAALTEQFHAMLIICTCGSDASVLEMTEQRRASLMAQASEFDSEGLVYQMAICDALARAVRGSSVARAQFDAALVRMAHAQRFADVGQAITQRPAAAVDHKKKVDASTPPPPPSPKPPRAAQVQVKVKTEINKTEQAVVGASTAPGEQDHQRGREIWQQVIHAARDSSAERARTSQLAYQAFDGQTLHLRMQDGTKAEAKFLLSQISVLEEQVGRVAGESLRVELAFADAAVKEASGKVVAKSPTVGKDAGSEPLPEDSRSATERGSQSNVCPEDTAPVRLAREIFDAMVVRIDAEDS